jgi:hypothetical protein
MTTEQKIYTAEEARELQRETEEKALDHNFEKAMFFIELHILSGDWLKEQLKIPLYHKNVARMEGLGYTVVHYEGAMYMVSW